MKLWPYQIEARDMVLNTLIGQIILPTGTGKSIIQGTIFESQIKSNRIESNLGFGIYVILTPRILLTNQLMDTVARHIISHNIQILTIHSGEAINLAVGAEDEYEKFVFANMKNESTTSSDIVITRIKEAKHKKQPLLICCTYHSVGTLVCALRKLNLKADQVLCDEAHYIVEERFQKSITDLKDHCDRIHFFTATQKITIGDDGNGMNNESFYGKVIFRKTPKEMIEAGYMIRPRIHYEEAKCDASWSIMVQDVYEKHSELISNNAKMLVCCNGTKNIEEICTKEFKNWCKEREITLYDISSVFGPRINGEKIKRNDFLKKLKGVQGKAIILHINILTEGIDVPDITGVMFIRNMGTVRFLQSLGRATRVLPEDFGKPTDNFEQNSKLWTKPYAWVIISEKPEDSNDKKSNIKTIIRNMRLAGFEPTEEVLIAIDRGTGKELQMPLCNKVDEVTRGNWPVLFDIQHEIELEKLAAMNDDDLGDFLEDFSF